MQQVGTSDSKQHYRQWLFELYFPTLITIRSVYIPPQYQLHKHEFQSFMDKLPQPNLILGDFNAHSSWWGDTRSDARGRLIENFLFSTGACLLNNKEPTFF